MEHPWISHLQVVQVVTVSAWTSKQIYFFGPRFLCRSFGYFPWLFSKYLKYRWYKHIETHYLHWFTYYINTVISTATLNNQQVKSMFNLGQVWSPKNMLQIHAVRSQTCFAFCFPLHRIQVNNIQRVIWTYMWYI